jgi:hypothetical protein
MARYFLHLHECGTVSPDLEGQECATLDEAVDAALLGARDVMTWELRSGKLCLGCHISVADASGREVARVDFRDAVSITGL